MKTLSLLLASALITSAFAAKPNFIIILTDDQGYNDLGCFGSETINTPNIDRMAVEGRKFTSFVTPSPLCTPSRAGLLTGCYPKRVGMHKGVLFPTSTTGLNPSEYTIADHFKTLDYATACVGKWHLGHLPEVLPRSQGFDSYYGIPYSNDMNYPANKNKVDPASDQSWLDQDEWVKKWNTPLMRNEEIIELPVNQRTITRRYTDQAIDFITENKDGPFFLYLAHSMPHIPLFVPEDAFDPDPKNAYKAVIEHIDAEVGRLLDSIRKLGLDDNTYVIFTSDNGPWLRFQNHGGSALPLRGGKTKTFEGGQRVPCIMWAPGQIPANTTTDALVSTIDLLPSLAALADSKLPRENKIDGINLSATIIAQPTVERENFLYYFGRGQLQGIRQGNWKLLIQGKNPPMLFNLKQDISESNNLSSEHPEKVADLTKLMIKLDEEITENARPAWKQ